MVTDFELAWTRLGEYIASRTQHGREGLFVEMQRIAAECRVPAGEFSRLLRLYGVEVERARSILADTDRDGLEPLAAGLVSAADGLLSGHDRPEGGHCGSSNGRSGSAGTAAGGNAG